MISQPLNEFNLITQPWVPVRDVAGGLTRKVSLDVLFRDASTIADLDCPPHERISIMRLLICITQAAIGAPKTPEDWEGFGDDLESAVVEYLHREDVLLHFDLFGEAPRFLQVTLPASASVASASKLVPHLATGNGATLFDHEGTDETRAFSPDRLAVALLAFQCFYPLYGAGYKGKGPCAESSMVHTLLQGSTLRKTILRNCLTQELIDSKFGKFGMGRPIWELDPKSKDYGEMATTSYLGRLVPRHRNLWLLDGGSGFKLEQKSLQYPPFPQVQEPSATVVIHSKAGESELRLLSARLGKAIWRDLHAIAVLQAGDGQQACSPLTIQSHAASLGDEIELWTGALVTDKAKFLDTTESTMTVPYRLFEAGGRRRYEMGIVFAETYSKQLYGAVKTFGASMKNESPPTDSAQRHFWNALESQVPTLLAIVRDDGLLEGKSFGESTDPWTRAVKAASRSAFDHVCSRQTPRQLEAYAAGLRILYPRSAKTNRTSKKEQATT